jgi:hypothetical protein
MAKISLMKADLPLKIAMGKTSLPMLTYPIQKIILLK